MSETEYRTEFSLWIVAAASMIVSTDLRQMSSFMKATLLNTEMLAIHQDSMGISGGLVMHDTTSDGCCAVKDSCQMWARPLTGGRWAMALYNRNNATASVLGQFTALPLQPAVSLLGRNLHAGAPPTKLKVRDVWEKKDLGVFTGSYSVVLAGHETAVLLLESPAGSS